MLDGNYYRCDMESAREGNIEIEECDPGDIRRLIDFILPNLEHFVEEHEYIFGDGGNFLIWAVSEEHAEELVRQHLNEDDDEYDEYDEEE